MSRDNDWAKAVIRERFGVSHETFERLTAYVGLLEHWQKRINLVAPSTLQEIWTRHILDSVQLFAIKPEAKHWLDLGSGGGLPGLVLGALLAEVPGGKITLVESNGKKGAFLRHVSAELRLPVTVEVERIEAVIPRLEIPEIVTARALASLDMLLGFSNLLLKSGAVGLFPKGREHAEELTLAHKNWHFSVQQHASVTESSSRILEISMAMPPS
ncbi:MAG: 16S rRNA (guanine(527)-N(7))-methyltransferase RsmG [Proteobacteria bacterium]|nr:16S rRNA (guanine(527)-N(7))-methyltransferase RsmG [Pseudomonadota bacterium]